MSLHHFPWLSVVTFTPLAGAALLAVLPSGGVRLHRAGALQLAPPQLLAGLQVVRHESTPAGVRVEHRPVAGHLVRGLVVAENENPADD